MTPKPARNRAGFVLDVGRCLGCAACVLACRLEHGWLASAPWRRIIPLNEKRHPGGPTYFLSVACHHCGKPACVSACPSGAFEQRADGIVVHRENLCMGCRYCEMACPFGAPRFDEVRGIVTKCDFCRSRIDADQPPACVAACPTDALQTCATVHDDETTDQFAVPGFSDATGCDPSIRFRPPRGVRGRRLADLLKRNPTR